MLKCHQANFSRVSANIFGTLTLLIITIFIFTTAYAANPKDILQDKCNSCHRDSVVDSYRGLSANQWRSVIARMQVKGTKISAQNKNILAKYLSDKYK